MNRLKRSLSLRSSKRNIPESVRPHVWENDSYKVRNGGVSFPVKYVGTVEVTESRGTQVCAEAFRKMKEASQGKKKRMTLLVTADCIRVVDEQTKSLVIDQTIEKVSFCTPDPSNNRVFSYICREGTTRRWMCHCFLAVRDTGERLSHAVGCAFTACLQRKQKAQALQEQHKKQKEGGSGQTGATASASSVALQPQAAAAPSTQPSVPATVPSGAVSTPTANGPIPQTPSTPSTLPPQPVVAQTPPVVELAPKSKPTATPLLQPPPSVARPRPQPFNPSPFTRHTSLRYRSNPLSFLPLKDTGGYETLLEEPQFSTAPKLPPAVDALTEQSSTVKPPLTQLPVTSAGFPSSQPGSLYNGVGASHPGASMDSTAHNVNSRTQLSTGASPLQPYTVQATLPANQSNPWPAHGQLQRRESEADKWLASAAQANPSKNGTQASDGLLTTYNPFGEMSNQLDALSSAWTKDLKTQLPASTSSQPRNGEANRGNVAQSPWGAVPASQRTREEDEFSFLATRHTGSPASPGSPKSPDSNPFGPPRESQVHWV